MDTRQKDTRSVDPSLSHEPEIGRWLWALQDARRRTMAQLTGLSQAVIDWLPGGDESSIGTLLYHIAAVEVDWLFEEVLVQPFSAEVDALFPHEMRDRNGSLTHVVGESFEAHLSRLEKVRGILLKVYQEMDLADFRRFRTLEKYDVTPEWVLHHLMQHEAEHRSQIGALRARAGDR